METMKTLIKVKMVDDFRNRWLESTARDENFSVEAAKLAYDGKQLIELSNRISGKECELTKCTYVYGSTDYFESLDGDFVIHPELFTVLSED